MNKFMSLLIVSAVIGSSTPVFAGYGYKEYSLWEAMNDQRIRGNRTLKAINKVYDKENKKENKFFHFKKTDKYEVNYPYYDTHGQGLGELRASISNVKVKKNGKVKFDFDITEGYFGGKGKVIVSEGALTETGKTFFKSFKE